MKVFLCIFAILGMAGGLLGLVLSATVFGEIMALLALVCAFGMFGAIGIMERQDKQIELQRLGVTLQKDTLDQIASLLSKIEPERAPPRR